MTTPRSEILDEDHPDDIGQHSPPVPMLLAVGDKDPVSSLEDFRSRIELELKPSIEDIPVMAPGTPVWFHIGSVLDEANPPLAFREDLLPHAVHRGLPFETVEVDPVVTQ